MNILIVGLGSMGQRRLRLIQANYPEISISGVEFSDERRLEIVEKYQIKGYSSIKDAVSKQKFDAAFVCTPPATHQAVITELLENDIHVFTELNLINKGYDKLQRLAESRDKQIFMSSTLLYRKEIQKICELVSSDNEPVQYIYHMGQYLPDWHPWESYKKFFVGNKETNGCREIFAIQLPWILACFGKQVSLGYVSKKKISSLEIDYPDSYLAALEHKSGNRGVLIIDVVSRKAACYLEIVGEHLHLIWDGTPTGLKTYNFEAKSFESISLYETYEHNSKYAANIIEDAYLDEIRCFLNTLSGNGSPKYTLADDAETLKLIDRIEGE